LAKVKTRLPRVNGSIMLKIDRNCARGAERCNEQNCPTARALERLFGDRFGVTVWKDGATLYGFGLRNKVVRFKFDQRLIAAIRDYDNTKIGFRMGEYKLTRCR
jgi:hypothetical protein